jgi:hypothetical protein
VGFGRGGAAGVADDEDAAAKVGGGACRAFHGRVGGHAEEDDGLDSQASQDLVELAVVESARPNLSCVAIALRDTARRPAAALSITGPTQGFDAPRNTAMLRTVSAEAEQLLRRAYVAERSDVAS